MRLVAVRVGVGALGHVVEIVDDPLGADDDGAVLEQEHGHGADAGAELELVAERGVLRYLARDEVDAELGQPLADALGAAAPLGLVELEHQSIASTTRARRALTSAATGSSSALPTTPSITAASIAATWVVPSST